MIRIFISILLIAYVSNSIAGDPVNVKMAKIGEDLQNLYPLLSDPDLPKKPNEVKLLKKNLADLKQNLVMAEKHLSQKPVTYAISSDVMLQFMDQIEAVLDEGEIEIAQGMLKSLPSICASCHSQDHQHSKLFTNVKREKFSNDFEFAEFSFHTRHYSQALSHYLRFLNDTQNTDAYKLTTGLQRVLVIQAQVDRNPAKALEILTKLSENKHYPVKVQLDIKQWMKGLGQVLQESAEFSQPMTHHELRAILSKFVSVLKRENMGLYASEKEKVLFLTLRGWLYDYLNDAPKDQEVPVILYWLAQCDSVLNFASDYGLADLYLKECMIKYPKHAYAQKCYKSYQDFVMLSYTGSGGTDIPEDVELELDALKEIIAPKDKVVEAIS